MQGVKKVGQISFDINGEKLAQALNYSREDGDENILIQVRLVNQTTGEIIGEDDENFQKSFEEVPVDNKVSFALPEIPFGKYYVLVYFYVKNAAGGWTLEKFGKTPYVLSTKKTPCQIQAEDPQVLLFNGLESIDSFYSTTSPKGEDVYTEDDIPVEKKEYPNFRSINLN